MWGFWGGETHGSGFHMTHNSVLHGLDAEKPPKTPQIPPQWCRNGARACLFTGTFGPAQRPPVGGDPLNLPLLHRPHMVENTTWHPFNENFTQNKCVGGRKMPENGHCECRARPASRGISAAPHRPKPPISGEILCELSVRALTSAEGTESPQPIVAKGPKQPAKDSAAELEA